jgi:2-octaprenyl-6-methoxyphenol hydroxylase
MAEIASFECIVVGTGPAGLAAALALSAVGAEVAVVGPPPTIQPRSSLSMSRTGNFLAPQGGTEPAVGAGTPEAPASVGDTRTAALFAGSIELLRNLGVWDAVAPESAPVRAIRIIDDTGGLLRAPEVLFEAGEIGLDFFGYNVPNAVLRATLHDAVTRHRRVHVVEPAAVTSVAIGHEQAILRTAEGAELAARLIVAADGRQSICRSAAGIETHSWGYEQSAIATSFAHRRVHDGISTEFHRRTGPCTTVPLPGLASSLVWVDRPAIAQRFAELPVADFRAALETRLHGLLGTLGEIGPRRLFPLSGLTADRFGRNRVALVGEAGHVLPPIGAQGLNLSLRDAAALAECVAEARRRGDDVGGPETLARHHGARRLDIASRRLGIDALNRTLIADLLPVHLLRGAGLHLVRAFSPLKRVLIQQGLHPPGPLPLLMRPGGGGLLAR